MASTLYDIEQRYQNLWELCLDDNVDLETLEQALQSVEGEITDKCANGIGLIQSLRNHAAGLDGEIKRLSQRKKAIDNRIEQIQTYFLDNLIKIGKSKIMTSRGVMSVVNAGGKRPLKIDDEESVPNDFKFITYNVIIDKDALRDALERNIEVDGAHLEERKKILRIY